MSVLVIASSLSIQAKNEAATNSIYLTNGEWTPYLSEKLPHYGFVSQIATEAFKLKGIEVVYGFYPWPRAYSEAKGNPKWSGTIIWKKSDQRSKDFYFSDPTITVSEHFFHRKSMPFDWNEIGDLKGYKIGIARGYFYGEAFEKSIKANLFTTDKSANERLAIDKLVAKRIDLFPGSREVVLNLLNKRYHESQLPITYHPKPIITAEYHLLISKKSTNALKLIKTYNEGLALLKKSGRYNEIHKF